MQLDWLLILISGLAWIFLILGLDDLVLDIYYWLKSRGGYGSALRQRSFPQSEKPIAIIVPAWKEAGIIGSMLRGNLRQLKYENYKFFVACYPNDLDTIQEVRNLNDKRVVCVVNRKEGPTSKGQALNEVVRQILDSSESYAAVLMQDSEDIMHPYVLQSINAALDTFDFIQTPVYSLPLGLKDFVAASYLDEFAEFHTKDQWVRSALRTATPSAGVGTAISVEMLRKIVSKRGDFLFEGSLTEDYELGHFVHKLGGRSTFLREILATRYLEGWSDPLRRQSIRQVATLEYFPRRLSTAVRQKTRWTIGIVLQGSSLVPWYGSLANRYFLYRDRKGLVMNILGLTGLLLTFIAGSLLSNADVKHARDLLYASISDPTKVCLSLNLLLAANRCLQRCIGVHRVYRNWGLTLTAPLRIPISLLINGLAAINALVKFTKSKLQKISLAWDKTQHELPQGFGLPELTFEPAQTPALQLQTVSAMQSISPASQAFYNPSTKGI